MSLINFSLAFIDLCIVIFQLFSYKNYSVVMFITCVTWYFSTYNTLQYSKTTNQLWLNTWISPPLQELKSSWLNKEICVYFYNFVIYSSISKCKPFLIFKLITLCVYICFWTERNKKLKRRWWQRTFLTWLKLWKFNAMMFLNSTKDKV